MIRIERRFEFGPDSPDYTTEGLRAYVPRLHANSEMLFPNATGTLVTAAATGEGAIISDWNGTWLAMNDANLRGLLILRDPGNSSPAKLILDYDSSSSAYLSSVDLTRPGTGWKEPLTEVEYLCFYDEASWPLAYRATTLPAGCTVSAVPINTSPPTLGGSAEVGQTLSVDPGTWEHADGGFAYEWAQCDGDTCTPIDGATDSTYLVDAADEGHMLRVTVTALSATGETETASATSAVIGAAACPTGTVCTADDASAFRDLTEASAATGVDADGLAVDLPDLGAVRKKVTLGGVTLRGQNLFVGASGVPAVENGDWTSLLPGPDIALAGKSKRKQLEIRFPAAVYAAGFEFVEPSTGPNVGPKFSDATFTVTLKRGAKVVGERTFNAPNDVVAYVGSWSDQAFNRMVVRSGDALGTKIFGKIHIGYFPWFSRRGNILVGGGGVADLTPTLTEVSVAAGRVRVQDFSDGRQGTPGEIPWDVASMGPNLAAVLDLEGYSGSGKALIFRVDLATGTRTVLHDLGNLAFGPAIHNARSIAVERSGDILFVDGRKLFRVSPVTGMRTVLSDFLTGARRGSFPEDVVVEASGRILVADFYADFDPATPGKGAIFRVNQTNGSREILSDFGKATQGPLGNAPAAIALDSAGSVLVIDVSGGTNFYPRLLRIDPATGVRQVISDFGSPAQGVIGYGRSVDVDQSGRIFVLYEEYHQPRGSIVRVNPVSGYRTIEHSFDDFSLGDDIRYPTTMAVRD
jgi:hypothetical protein